MTSHLVHEDFNSHENPRKGSTTNCLGSERLPLRISCKLGPYRGAAPLMNGASYRACHLIKVQVSRPLLIKAQLDKA